MADKDDIEELKDLVSFLQNALESVSTSGDKFAEKIIAATRQSVNLNNVFEELVDTMEGLPKNIINGKDLQQSMLKDAKLFKKVQHETNIMTQKAFKEGWSKIEASLKKSKKTEDEIKKARAEYMDTTIRISQEFDKQFQLMQRQAKEEQKISVAFVDVKKNLDSMGAAIRDPGEAMNGLLGGLSAFPNKIREASEEAGGFGKMLQDMGKKALVFFGPAGLLALGFAALIAPIILVHKTFSALWDFMDKKVMPATAALNKEFGNMGQSMGPVSKEVMKAGVQFELLGRSFGEGAQAATKFLGSLMHVPGTSKEATIETQKLAKAGLMLSEYVGLGAEQAGKLTLQFQKAGMGADDLNKSMVEASTVARDYAVPVNQIRKDLGENIEILSRFGIKNRMVFLESAAKARTYGLSIKDVNSAFGEQMDTFEGTSETAAKLNTIFGTHINSYKLMLEQNPVKRMEMLRGELLKQGKSWDSLNAFEQDVITSTMHVSKEQAALVLSSGEARRKLEADIKQRKRMDKVNNDWEKGLSNIKETLIAWQPLIDRVMRSMAKFFGKVLFGIDTTQGFNKTAKVLEELMGNITKWFDAATVAAGEQGLTGLIMDAPKFFNDFNASIKDTKEFVSDVSIAIAALGDTIDAVFSPMRASTADEMIERLRGGMIDAKEQGDMLKKLNDDPKLKAIFEKKLKREGSKERGRLLDVFDPARMASKQFGNIIEERKSQQEKILHGSERDQLRGVEDLKKLIAEKEKKKKKTSFDELSLKSLNTELSNLTEQLEKLRKQQEEAESGLREAKKEMIFADDALITKKGEVVKFNPDDNILATKAKLPMEAPTEKSGKPAKEVDIERIVRSVMKEMKPEIKVEVMDINLDGKKIGAAQVKISRY